jgi:hypothetical protein
MYGNNDLSDRNKDNNINPEDYGQKAEEQQQQEQHCAFNYSLNIQNCFYHILNKEKKKLNRI